MVDMIQGSPKTIPDSGQSGIWTQNICMQFQHPDRWATLLLFYISDCDWEDDDDDFHDKKKMIVWHVVVMIVLNDGYSLIKSIILYDYYISSGNKNE